MTTERMDPFRTVPGVRLGCTAAGIRYQGREDLVVLELPADATTAAVFTRNAFCAAPVVLAKQHLDLARPRYLLINAGNANAGTGGQGIRDAMESCSLLAGETGVFPHQILPFSTGVIGDHLPMDRFVTGIPRALESLAEDGWACASRAIMTTDTVPKLVSRTFQIDGKEAVVTGMAKGAGMICPNMATMLAFVATDAAVDAGVLQRCLSGAADASFNAITIDGDTSTNDACVLCATGTLGNTVIDDEASADYLAMRAAVEIVCGELATAIVRDGEGATKLVRIRVEEAVDRQEARRVAETVAHSPLVKTALFASDPNWGRILAAVGRAGIEDLEISGVRIWLGEVPIVSDGGRAAGYTEQAGAAVMAEPEILIRIALDRGQASTQMLTCDLSYEYVRINAEYRT